MRKIQMKRTKKEFKDYNDYHDRPFGLKWGTAFALEELNHAIEINKRNATVFQQERPLMSRDELDNILQIAFVKQKMISIQLSDLDDLGNYLPSVEGKFEGFADENNLYLDGKAIPWNSIRNIEIK